MIDRQPRRSSNGLPFIAMQGVEVGISDVPYIQMAAEELNLSAHTLTPPGRYWIIFPSASEVEANGLKPTPDKRVVRVAGTWALDHERDLTEFDDRAEQIKADFSGL